MCNKKCIKMIDYTGNAVLEVSDWRGKAMRNKKCIKMIDFTCNAVLEVSDWRLYAVFLLHYHASKCGVSKTDGTSLCCALNEEIGHIALPDVIIPDIMKFILESKELYVKNEGL